MNKKLSCYTVTAAVITIFAAFLALTGFNHAYPDKSSIHSLNDRGHSDNNVEPEVKIVSPEAGTVFQNGARFRYQIRVDDPVRSTPVTPIEVFFIVDFIPEDSEVESQKFIMESGSEVKGVSLLREKSCFSCHADKSKMLGPSFEEIFERYGNTTSAVDTLSESIKNGTFQKWEGYEMPAFSELSGEELNSISEFILAQGSNKNSRIFTGSEGIVSSSELTGNKTAGQLIFTASYVNGGGQGSSDTIVTEVR